MNLKRRSFARRKAICKTGLAFNDVFMVAKSWKSGFEEEALVALKTGFVLILMVN